MPTKFVYLEGEQREYLNDLCRGMYLDGQCYEFATALHRGLGWPMFGLMQGSIVGAVIRHSVVLQPNGKYRDVRGEITEREVGRPFDDLEPPYILGEVTEADLRAVRPVSDTAIELAAKFAEALFPNLPWKSGQQKRFKEFADGLEKLSRETGVWVRSMFPGCPPVLADGDDAESGYKLEQTGEGLGFTIDRYFH